MNVNSSPVGAASTITFDNVDRSNINVNSLADSVPPANAVKAAPAKAVQVTVVPGMRFSNPA
jgi:hypothetical protein